MEGRITLLETAKLNLEVENTRLREELRERDFNRDLEQENENLIIEVQKKENIIRNLQEQIYELERNVI